MGARAQGLIIALVGLYATLIGYGAETQIEGSGPLIWIGFSGIFVSIGGIAWAILGSRYTSREKAQE